LTAAHRSLPFGSKVKVTNRHNGRSIVVTVIDRGPFVRGRIIDLTPAAGRALGFSGLAPVTVAANRGGRVWASTERRRPLVVDAQWQRGDYEPTHRRG
jgi:rare lipoprotein A